MEYMYSVKQVAESLDISRQAVYKRINRESFQEHMIECESGKYISEEGFQQLKRGSMKSKEIIEEFDHMKNQNSTRLQILDNRLVDTLNSIIVSKDSDIKDLKSENKKLLELMQQQNQLLHNSQELQQKALNNTEILLLQKRYELLIKQAEFEENKKKTIRERLRILFKGK